MFNKILNTFLAKRRIFCIYYSDTLLRKIPVIFFEDVKCKVIYASELHKAIQAIINIEYDYSTPFTPTSIDLYLHQLSNSINKSNQDENYLKQFKSSKLLQNEQMKDFT